MPHARPRYDTTTAQGLFMNARPAGSGPGASPSAWGEAVVESLRWSVSGLDHVVIQSYSLDTTGNSAVVDGESRRQSSCRATSPQTDT